MLQVDRCMYWRFWKCFESKMDLFEKFFFIDRLLRFKSLFYLHIATCARKISYRFRLENVYDGKDEMAEGAIDKH